VTDNEPIKVGFGFGFGRIRMMLKEFDLEGAELKMNGDVD